MQDYMKELWKLYKEQPALYEIDYDPSGFEWINHMAYDKSMLTFIRKGKKRESTLVFVCNFSDVAYEKYQMGVPYPGKYKEIFNSDAKKFGGNGVVNARVKASKREECDERKNSIVINVAPLSVQIFSFTKNETKKAEKKTEEKAPKVSKVRKQLQEKMEAEHLQEAQKYEAKAEKTVTEEVKKTEKPEEKTAAKTPEKKPAVQQKTVLKESREKREEAGKEVKAAEQKTQKTVKKSVRTKKQK